MAELISLAVWTRSKAGRAFGPETLRGQMPPELDLHITGLTREQRITSALDASWRSVTEIADMTGIEEKYVRHICRRLFDRGSAERQLPSQAKRAVRYRRRQPARALAA